MKVSVVIPSHNRREKVKQAVKSLVNQDFPKKDYEIIVVSDSWDGTEQAIAKIKKNSKVRISFFRKESDGPSQKRNVGWKNAKGNIVAFIDDDCVAGREWLKNIHDAFQGKVGAVEGKTLTDDGIGPFTHYILNERGGQYMTCNMAYKRELLKKMGGFDENFTTPVTINREDSDLAFSIMEKGYRIAFARNAIVRHPVVKTGLVNRLKKKKEFFVDPLLYKKHPELYKSRIKFPFEMFTPFYILFTALSLLFWQSILLIFLIGLYELMHRKWSVSFTEFFKFLVLQVVGSFIVVIFYLYGCVHFRVNPLRPLLI